MILDDIIKNKENIQRKMSAENNYDLKKMVNETHKYVENISNKFGIKIRYAHYSQSQTPTMHTKKAIPAPIRENS
jgi:hypothetical protein